MSDLISRRAAIDMVESVIDGNASAKAWTILARLKTLPSAQPETAKRTAESEQNVSNGDLISRKAVIEVLDRTQWLIPYAKNVLKDDVKILPSAQPEVDLRKRGEWDMFELITSAWYGKQCYFKQSNDIVYSRLYHKYMTVDEAIREFLGEITDG